MFFSKALIEGLGISVIMCMWIAVIIKINPRYEMKSYPKEITNLVSPQTKKEKKGFLKIALPMVLIVITGIVYFIYNDYKNIDVSYITLFIHTFVVFQVWNIFDLFIMDWLIFCTVQPKFMIMPGTDGSTAYKDYKYHFIGFLKGIIISTIGSIIISAIVFFILRLR